VILVVLGLLIFQVSGTGLAQEQTPLTLVNARIYTLDARQPWADAVAIDANGLIIAVGGETEVLEVSGKTGLVVDLAGQMVLPGFQDVHLHALEAGINKTLCEFGAGDLIADIEWSLRRCALDNPGKDWLVGAGINTALLLENFANPVLLLDGIVADRPVLVLDDLGHGAWANSLALRIVGYDRLGGDPPGGIIVRDERTGKPNGIVLENAQQVLRNAAFAPTKANFKIAFTSLVNAQKILSANGITSVSDAGGYWPQLHVKAWEKAEKDGALTVRASNALYLYPDRPFSAQMMELKALFSNRKDRLVRFDQVKIYVDGILSQATGAMYQPYEKSLGLDTSDERGFEYFEKETLTRYAKALVDAGFQLHFHATGDRGAGIALDTIEAVGGKRTGPHRITHLYQVAQKDLARFKQLGVFADFQLAPSSTDKPNRQLMAAYLGKRSENLLPIRSLLDAGAQITLSSDWDADGLSPLLKLQTAITRDGYENVPDLATAIEMMTLQAARLLRHDAMTGSIEVGKFADLVVIDRNLFDLPPGLIGEAKVKATLLQGVPVYDPVGLFN